MTNHKIQVSNPIEKHFDVLSRYHYYFFFILFVSKVPVFWHVLNLIFLTPPMDYYCDNATDFKNSCPCEEPWWDRSVFTETVQTKFDLKCEKQWMISFTNSVAFFGMLVGAFVFGVISDKYGRVTSFSISCLILAIAGCLISVMPSASLLTFMRFMEGFAAGGAIVTSFVVCIEYCGVRHREVITALYHLPVNVSHCCLAGVSYILRHCDDFQLAISIPMFIFAASQWLIMESPKWLMDKGRLEKAATVLERASKYGRNSSPTIREEMEEFVANHTSQNPEKVQFWQIFKHKRITINLMCMSFIYFVCGMGYYGVSQYIGQMNGDIHVNVAISGVLLVPGTIAATFLLKLLHRRTFCMASCFLSGLFMLIVPFIPDTVPWARVIIACICNCFFLMTFMIVFLYGAELFPTTIRNSAIGFLSLMSRIGQISAPQINSLSPTTSAIVFGSMAIIASVLCIPLPETKNIELPSTLEESATLATRRTSHEERGTEGTTASTTRK